MTPMVLAVGGTPLVDGALAVLIGIGASLVLAAVPWFSRTAMTTRIGPYLPNGAHLDPARANRIGLRETLAPTLEWLGRILNRALGVVTDLPIRLQRAGLDTDPYDFRLRQMAFGVLSLIISAVLWVMLPVPLVLGSAILVALPTIAVLAVEQWLNHRIDRRTERLGTELPVIIEQLGMLVSAGYSLTSAVAHIAVRGSGVVASDFVTVTTEIRRGVPPADAFSDWANTTGMPAVDRVVAVLALNSEASDLGSLISAEARSIRAAAHRDLLETIEKRSQLVWIPVTVATLVPGLIFLAVPFYAAMAKVTGG